jgi:hypothetical protein
MLKHGNLIWPLYVIALLMLITCLVYALGFTSWASQMVAVIFAFNRPINETFLVTCLATALATLCLINFWTSTWWEQESQGSKMATVVLVSCAPVGVCFTRGVGLVNWGCLLHLLGI